jgi:hypothetical protein
MRNDHSAEVSVRALLDAWDRVAPERPVVSALALLAAGSGLGEEEARQLALGERDRRLLELRAHLFGTRMANVATCPRCGETVEFACDTRDLSSAGAGTGEAGARQLVLRLRHGEHEVWYRRLTSDDLLALPETEGDSWRWLFTGSVVRATRLDEDVDAGALPPEVRAAVVDAMAAADPLADVELSLGCPSCGESWRAGFDIASYLASELDAWARRLLADVHTVARRYGWSEAAILGMSARRRELYLGFGDA